MENKALNIELGDKIQWIERIVSVESLKPYERNPRKISKESYAALKASITELGFHQRILCQPDLSIAGGHQRVRALKELGFKEIAVLVPDRTLTDDEFRRLLVTDNPPFGDFDFDMLAVDYDVGELGEWGMSDKMLASLPETANEGLTDPDEVPEPPEIPKTVLGDLWLLGEHRLLCGDSTAADTVSKLLRDEKPNLMVTDPPYGVSYDPQWRENHDLNIGKKIGGVNQKGRSLGRVLNDDCADWREAWALFPGNVAYVWHGGLHTTEVCNSLESVGFKIRAQIIWVKQHFVFGRGDYHWQHEPCLYAVRNKGDWTGDRKQTTVWHINNNNPFGNGGNSEEKVGHGTQKPIECMRRPIENNSKPGDAIYEPFSGSGTTIIAAEQTDRRCFAIELSPAYVDMAITRWQNFTGKTATHAVTGAPYGRVNA